MLEMLLIGLPNDRPGGLVLTLLCFVGAAALGLLGGLLYACAAVANRPTAWALSAFWLPVRGIPPILLVFLMAHVISASPAAVGILGLALYSASHVGEILRSFLVTYPRDQLEQAKVTPLSPWTNWVQLRLPWTLTKAGPALITHWVSLLKDTGALVVIGVAELMTTAKILAENKYDLWEWSLTIATAALLYLGATALFVGILSRTLIDVEDRRRTDVVALLR